MHDEDTCCVDGCLEPPHVRCSRKFPHLSGACKYHYHAEASYRPVDKPEPRACLWCGAEFQPSRKDHRCCSKNCSTSWGVRGRRNLNSIPRACEFCGADLTGTRRRFCSQRCRGRAIEHPGRTCAECGVTFWLTGWTTVCESCGDAQKAKNARSGRRGTPNAPPPGSFGQRLSLAGSRPRHGGRSSPRSAPSAAGPS